MTTDQVAFKIGLLGPSRVGKTSLVTAMLSEAQRMLAGSGVAMVAADTATEVVIDGNREALQGDLLSGEFLHGSLLGTVEPTYFKLALDPGVPDARIDIELLDFPGGWIKPKDRVGVEDQWEKCRKFIAASTILLVPVDASLLMETTEKEHLRLLPQFLTTVQVEQVARDWAIERNRRPEEPALVAFCPVKGEAYFNDNGGIKNRSVLLRQRFDTVYAGVVQAVRAEAPKATILYAPVDTIGCVELVRADWTKSSTGIWGFDAKYRVRGKAEISRMGVDDLMTAIAQQLIYGKRLAGAQESDDLRALANRAAEYAERSEGFFRDIWLWVNRERQARRTAAAQHDREAREALHRVLALDAVLEKIAAQRFGPRVSRL